MKNKLLNTVAVVAFVACMTTAAHAFNDTTVTNTNDASVVGGTSNQNGGYAQGGTANTNSGSISNGVSQSNNIGGSAHGNTGSANNNHQVLTGNSAAITGGQQHNTINSSNSGNVTGGNITGGNVTGGNITTSDSGNVTGGNISTSNSGNVSTSNSGNVTGGTQTNTNTASNTNNGLNGSVANSGNSSNANSNDNENNNNTSSSVEINNAAQARNPVSTAYSAPLIAADDTCMGSSSAGAQTVGLGVSIGTTWQDKECVRRKDARELHNMGMKTAAVALMCQDKNVQKAMETAGTPCPGADKAETYASVESSNKPRNNRSTAGTVTPTGHTIGGAHNPVANKMFAPARKR